MDRNTLLFFAISFAIMVVWYGLIVPGEDSASRRDAPPRQAETLTAPAPGLEGAEDSPGAERSPSRNGSGFPELPEQKIQVSGELYDALLTSRGGGLLGWRLRNYDDAALPGRPQVELITLARERGRDMAAATPLRGLGYGNLAYLDYEVERPGPHTVIFTRALRGVVVRKTYLFSPDEYVVRLRIDVENNTDRHLRPNFNVVWPARATHSDTGFSEFTLSAYTDGDLESFIIDPPDMLFGGGGSDEAEEYSGVEWAGAHSRYFLAAFLPDNPRDAQASFQPVRVGSEALLQVKFSEADVPPGVRLDREYRIYLGPKLPEVLDAEGSNLSEAIFRGWVPWLTRLFERMLEAAYQAVPNYGVAILLITVLVRISMAPLMTKQMKSMKRMSKLQPEIKEVQEKYQGDREKQSVEMMAIYKKHGLSPFSMFSGCLPMLLQLPVFIGFYYALQSSISLRQQPFFGWMDDLSKPESLFTIPVIELPVRALPILMGLSMFLQQKFTPTTMDPAQARMMLWMMPVMFTFLFYQFASGLVLYWFTSTLLGIGQQWLTNRRDD